MAKQREASEGSAGSEGSADETHRWAVDRVEEGTAAVEQDGDHVYEIPRWLLPAGARDGDVLSARVTASGDGEVTITVRVDPAAKKPKGAKAKRSPKDPGGDVVL